MWLKLPQPQTKQTNNKTQKKADIFQACYYFLLQSGRIVNNQYSVYMQVIPIVLTIKW